MRCCVPPLGARGVSRVFAEIERGASFFWTLGRTYERFSETKSLTLVGGHVPLPCQPTQKKTTLKLLLAEILAKFTSHRQSWDAKIGRQ